MLNFSGVFVVCFVVVFGLILTAWVFILVRSVKSARRTAELKRVGIRVSGTVTDNQMESRTSSSTVPSGVPDMPARTTSSSYLVFRPVVRFHSQSGQEITTIASNVSRRSFIAGTQVPLIYHPDRPNEVMIDGGPGAGRAGAVVMSIMIGIFLLAMLVFAIFAYTLYRSNHSPDASCPPGFPPGVSCTTN